MPIEVRFLGHPASGRHPPGGGANRSHVDISIDDVDGAMGHIEAIGGSVKKQPSLDPRPESFGGEVPLIDWAVMQDPFGNEFCLVSPLSDDEIAAVVGAPESGGGLATDRDWRAAAGRTGEVQPTEAHWVPSD